MGPTAEWKGVNLADCLKFDLRYALRDLLKTSTLLEKAIEGTRPSSLLSDAGPGDGLFPAYPYLYPTLPLLRAQSERRHIPFRALASSSGPRRANRPPSAPPGYARLIARQALRRLESRDAAVAVGPYPDFYSPLARPWKARGRTLVVATPLRSLIRPRGADGFSVLPFEKCLTARDRADVALFGRSLGARIDEVKGTVLTIPDRDVVEGLFRMHLRLRMASLLPELAAVGIAFERALHRASDLILVETVSPLGKAAARYAHKWKVPVTILQHGILGDVSSYGDTEGDAVAAWGPEDAVWFQSHLGLRTRATGCPRYDILAEGGDTTPGSAVLANIPPRKRVVMFASQPFVPAHVLASPWTHAEAMHMAYAAAATSEDNVLLIKWHPSQRPEPLPEGPERPTVVEAHRGSTFACLRRADVLLVVSSTVALEGMFLDRPVVFLGPQDALNHFDPPGAGAGLRALTAEEAARHVERLQRDPAVRESTLRGQREFLARRYAPLDGQAAKRAVDFISGR